MTGDLFPEVPRLEDPNRRYTTQATLSKVKQWLGVDAFDLDPAADEESHHAPRWFSVQPYPGSSGVNGLAQSWEPPPMWRSRHADWRHYMLPCPPAWRVFNNPPFDDLEPWLERGWGLLQAAENKYEVRMGMILPGNRHEQPWWHRQVERFRFEISRDVRYGYELVVRHFEGRQNYAQPGTNGVEVEGVNFPSVCLTWRRSDIRYF